MNDTLYASFKGRIFNADAGLSSKSVNKSLSMFCSSETEHVHVPELLVLHSSC